MLLLQGDTRHLIPVSATPCIQPLCAGLRNSVTHGMGSVTDKFLNSFLILVVV